MLGWLHHLPAWLTVFVGSMLPVIELRGTIPYGILGTTLTPWIVVALAILGTWLVGIVLFLCTPLGLRVLERWPWFHRQWERYTHHAQRKIHARVERQGSLGLVIFIAIPLPGFGVYTGAIGAYLLGMSLRRYLLVSLIGCILAGAVVTGATYSGSSALDWIVSRKMIEQH